MPAFNNLHLLHISSIIIPGITYLITKALNHLIGREEDFTEKNVKN